MNKGASKNSRNSKGILQNGQNGHSHNLRGKSINVSNSKQGIDVLVKDKPSYSYIAVQDFNVSPEDYANITFKIKRNYHQKLKVIAANEMKRLNDILNEALGKFIDENVTFVSPEHK
jgi:hypothetical protein